MLEVIWIENCRTGGKKRLFAKQFLQCISKAVGPSVEEDSLTLWPAKQTIKLFLGDTLTFAGPLLQAGVIQNCNVAASVVNQSRSLQSACRGCDPCSSHTQHHGEELLREREF